MKLRIEASPSLDGTGWVGYEVRDEWDNVLDVGELIAPMDVPPEFLLIHKEQGMTVYFTGQGRISVEPSS